MVYTRFYDTENLPFNRAEALRYFGYANANQRLSPEVEQVFESCTQEAFSACLYQVCYAEFDVVKEGEWLNLGFCKTQSQSLLKRLNACRKVVAFAATIGLEIDRLIARYSAISPVKACAFQAIGAERIETLCNAFQRDIQAIYQAKGMFVRPRFSCGYGDFPLAHQRDFLTALDCNRKIGVTLNQSLLMSPSKSVTALIGISEKPAVCPTKEDKCDFCDRRSDCSFKN